jgi:uncharacterized protein YbjT (DUF2867 family)
MASILVAGGTGYLGRAVVAALVARGHEVRVLTRAASTGRVPDGAAPVVGNALDAGSYSAAVRPGDTIVHLVGTPHPSPAKVAEFRRVDGPSIRAAVEAATRNAAAHVVYVSVAHPAPVMRAYIEVRAAGEATIRAAGLTATILRPWYVLGPGHRWPTVLVPLYAVARVVPVLRAGAERLGLVTLEQMVAALVGAVEHPPAVGTVRMLDVAGIRSALPMT